jgi:MFS transporter, FHS family, Na+ dependent glucose transporter 1
MTSLPGAQPINTRMLTAAYYLSFIVLGLATAVEGPSLPTLAMHTTSPFDKLSLIFVFGSLGYLFGSMIAGWAYDRFPSHHLMALALMAMVAAAIVFPLATLLWVLLFSATASGLGKGILDVGCNTLLKWVHGNKVAPYMNGLHFFFGLGSFLSPILLAQIISATYEIYWVFWIIAMITLLLAILFWFLPEPYLHLQFANEDHGSINLMSVLLIVLAFFLYVGAETGFANWIYTYAITLKLATTVTAAYLTSAFWGVFTIGRLFSIWISIRARTRTILFGDLAGCFASLGLIVMGGDSQFLLWTGSLLLGLSLASIFPTLLILAGQSMKINGKVTGWFLVGGGLGNMFLPWLIGQAFTSIGPHSMMMIIIADLAVELCVLLIVIFGRQLSVPALNPLQK